MQISVVIPTKNRKTRLLALLNSLLTSLHPVYETIIVDSGDDRLNETEIAGFHKLNPIYTDAPSSVCVQRNKGIGMARSPWVFLCDDDIEIPADYLVKLTTHISKNPDSGAISGLFLQKENGIWTSTYPVTSGKELLLKYIFRLSIWGEINYSGNNKFLTHIQNYYRKKGNHLSRSGWPVITDFQAPVIDVPVYTLGAALIRKEWLHYAIFDEVLDRHGIGENYGVCVSLPGPVQLLQNAFVYHHHEENNRLQKALQYYRRALALDYFISSKNIHHVRKYWLLWSLLGNFLIFTMTGNKVMSDAALKTFWRILTKPNPYSQAAKAGKTITEPLL